MIPERPEPAPPGVHRVRLAEPDELHLLGPIELAAGARFDEIGFDLQAEVPVARSGRQPAVVWVAGRPPVGFAWVELLDGQAHLEELAVLPEHGRAGLGRALVAAVADWAAGAGFEAVTLCTYRDVPWNGPFYARCGFEVLARRHWTPGLRQIRRAERRAGLDHHGARVVMTRRTAAPSGSTTRGGR
ncbi:MAG TPA: GNAT family N-acetyltransferase [Acidimicrobiales bacterium]|nr:GNAT family N-acetyltransferase [Acidimicrobiales bacterium]